jgi:hypothetical protein
VEVVRLDPFDILQSGVLMRSSTYQRALEEHLTLVVARSADTDERDDAIGAQARSAWRAELLEVENERPRQRLSAFDPSLGVSHLTDESCRSRRSV